MILLDSHVCLWLLHDPERIGSSTRQMIRDDTAYFSAVTTAELVIKRLTGKIRIPDGLSEGLVAAGLRSLPLTDAHASALDEFPELARHDPFDRLLLAQTLVEGGRFVTVDRTILSQSLSWVLDARA